MAVHVYARTQSIYFHRDNDSEVSKSLLANVGKNICWLLASASRGSINMRFAKRNNMGDISGKAVS